MASKTQSIEQVLRSALSTWATAQSVSVSWPNEPFDPTSVSKYVAVDFLPANPQTIFIERTEKQRWRGIFQVTIMVQAGSEVSGRFDVYTLEESLNTVFKRGYPLSYGGLDVQIENVTSEQIISDGAWVWKPVSINFRCEV
jgi:hypothetical protein